MHSETIFALTYTCVCGDRVTVFKAMGDDGIPPVMTTSCRNGHVTTLTPEQLIALEMSADGEDMVGYAA
jgi:hypothetical protein